MFIKFDFVMKKTKRLICDWIQFYLFFHFYLIFRILSHIKTIYADEKIGKRLYPSVGFQGR